MVCFFFKQKTAYEMRISDWSSDVCSSDLDSSLKEQSRMKRADEDTIPMRIVVERPVVAVRHSLQTKDNRPFDAKESAAGEALSFDFPVRLAPGPKIGSASCRESVCPDVYISVVSVSFKQKQQTNPH